MEERAGERKCPNSVSLTQNSITRGTSTPVATAISPVAATAAAFPTVAATATATTPVASSAAAAATAGRTFFPRPGLGDGDVATIEVLAGESADGGLSFLGRGHGDEGETTRAAGGAVGDDVDFLHDAVRGEEVLEGEFGGVEGQVSDEHFIAHDDDCLD